MQTTYHAITGPDCREIATDMLAALTPLLAAHGLTIQRGKATYTPTSFRIPLTVTVLEAPSGKAVAQADFERHAPLFGLDPSNYGRTFTIRGRTFTLTALNLNARKRPIQATANGKTWVFPEFTPTQMQQYGLTPAPSPDSARQIDVHQIFGIPPQENQTTPASPTKGSR